MKSARIAVLIPCFNEAVAIGKVVSDFRAALGDAVVYVYDNNSTDSTAEMAVAAGAVVRRETLQGKGHVIRRMFADIEADAYVLVDGDDTYDAAAAPAMVSLLLEGQLDMVNGRRTEIAAQATGPAGAYRRGHRMGNKVLSGLVRAVFGDRIQDMLSGYRVFSRRFVKTFPALASGFETETEFTIHALNLMMPLAELPVAYRERGVGSDSKLRTYSDGLRILRTIVVLVKEERPLQFFTSVGAFLLVLGVVLGAPVVATYLHIGLVPRLPTAVLATGIILLSFLAFSCGLILDSVARARKEAKRFAYLAIPRWGAENQSIP
jgi:glycosyltransferase involved in cell wall biosynthesis